MRLSFARDAEGGLGVRSGQAMIETVIAVLIITSVFLLLFKLSHMLTGKIMLEHAAMRIARARTVGLNDFMCLKSARVAVIPVAGRRLWPSEKDGGEFNWAMEAARARIYMQTGYEGVARGVLEYEGWKTLFADPGHGGEAHVGMKTDWFDLKGKASLERNYNLYMNDEGR